MKVTAAPKQAVQFIKESRDELQKVNWPSRQQTVRYTIIVAVVSLAVGAITGGFDYLLTLLFEKFII